VGLDRDPASVPFRYVDGLILVDASLHGLGETLTFAVDSGSSVSVMTQRVADALGVPLTAPQTVAGAASTAEVAAARMPALRVGALEVAPTGAYVVDGFHEQITSCDGTYRIDGLVGASVLWQLVTVIDYQAGVLVLSQQELQPADDEVVVPLHSSRYGDIEATARIAGQPAARVLVDTGSAGGVTVPRSLLPMEGVPVREVEGAIMRDLSGPISGGAFLRVPLRWASSPATVHDGVALPGLTGINIGNAVLDDYRVILDGPAQRMLLTPRRASKATPSIGFTFTRDRVDSVVRGSAVHRAGVVPGDRIVDLRGTRLDALDFTAECDLRARLASERFTATFIHAGKRVRVTVTPAPLF
jgi:predicted aspartyl protease